MDTGSRLTLTAEAPFEATIRRLNQATGRSQKMCRATIIGNAAGGKSTLCKAIADAHQLPIHAVDKLQWRPGWTAVQ